MKSHALELSSHFVGETHEFKVLAIFQARVNRVVMQLNIWVRNYHTRRQLKKLDALALADVGITRRDAEIESRKPFWR